MVEKSVSLDILSDNMYRLSLADHSNVSNSLFCLKIKEEKLNYQIIIQFVFLIMVIGDRCLTSITNNRYVMVD